MSDIVLHEIRSEMTSRIRPEDTNPEMILRKGLHRLGYRYRLHDQQLFGKPDMVFPRYHAVIFAHGCFWHGHSCQLFKWPSTNFDFWHKKINANIDRNKSNFSLLYEKQWRVGIVWECALIGKYRFRTEDVIELCADWLESEVPAVEIGGQR